MALTPGTRLGVYEVTAQIGEGGMGQVYRATDTKLKRQVAIKILPPSLAADHDRLARFQREAEVLASLNHPNIAAIHGLEESGGMTALVMELVEGDDLSQRIARGAIPLDDALPIAKQIAEALEAAHEQGIIHRDLKPANIKVRADGRVKVLDFGLAKAMEPVGAAATSAAMSPTLSLHATQAGMILGTAAYMAPEQASGKPVDKRADIWAFGVVMWEMLTGKRMFEGETISHVLAAVLTREPDLTAVPPRVRHLLTRCLKKNPRARLRDIGEARLQVEELLSGAPEDVRGMVRPGSAPLWRRALPWAMLATGLAVGVVATVMFAPKPTVAGGPDLAKYRFTPISREEATERNPAWSPDGTSIAYTASVHGLLQVFTRALGASDAAQITHGDKVAFSPPFWSPDGSTVYFQSDNGVWAVSATGGTPERIFERADSAAIHRDGKTFVFRRDAKLWTSTRSGEPREFPVPPELASASSAFMIGFSPDGSKLAEVDGKHLWIFGYPSGEARKFASDAREASWMPDSRRLVTTLRRDYLAGGLSIIDTADGSERVIYSTQHAIVNPVVSPDGKRIAYVDAPIEWDVMEVAIPSGRVRTMQAGGGVSWFPAWAPSGTHYLFATLRVGHFSIEDASAAQGFSREVAQVESAVSLADPRWSPDGARFTFIWTTAEGTKIMLSNASGGRMTPLDPNFSGTTSAAVWSPDSQQVMYLRTSRTTRDGQVMRIRPASSAFPEVLMSAKVSEIELARSPLAWSDKWILASGRDGLYLETTDFKTERKLTSRVFGSSGYRPAVTFSKDGRQVLGLYRNTTGNGAEWQLYSIDIATSMEKLLVGVDLPVTTDSVAGFSLHPDGTRFATSIAKWPFDIWMLEGFE